MKTREKKKVRIYVGGCWDLMHSGHYNAIRQAKKFGDILVVGILSDAEISSTKRSPVMNNEQRIAAVQACKWVDEIIFDVPYTCSLQFINKINCDFVAHGDDIAIDANGNNAYQNVMDKLKIFTRTPGISTTYLIEKLLNAVSKNENTNEIIHDDHNLALTSKIFTFSNNKTPQQNDIIIYIDGIFDLFHIGHIAALKKAKEFGTFLYVGLFDDNIIQEKKGEYFPLMNLQERILNVLSCKYVDDIIIGSPLKITKQFLQLLNIKYVVNTLNTQFDCDCDSQFDRYNIPKKLKIFKQLETNSNYTTDILMKNIIERQHQLESQNKNKIKQLNEYINNVTFDTQRFK